MKDVTFRPETLREAVAEARVLLDADARRRIAEGRVSKGDVLEASRLAAMIAVKRTPDVLPFCHPLPVGGIDARATLEGDGVCVRVTVRGIAATGFEMEALTGATVGALNVYDMMKPHTDAIALQGAVLLSKSGGTADWRVRADGLAAVVLGEGSAPVVSRLEASGMRVVCDPAADAAAVDRALASGPSLIVVLGGDLGALAQRVQTPLPGVIEAARAYGQRRQRFAMLEAGVCGWCEDVLLLGLPGGDREVERTAEALLPPLLRVLVH